MRWAVLLRYSSDLYEIKSQFTTLIRACSSNLSTGFCITRVLSMQYYNSVLGQEEQRFHLPLKWKLYMK